MAVPDDAVDAVRGFNRAYTRRFGLLDQQHLGSDFSLGEVRVLYELAHRDGLSAAGLARSLELDPGHLSRMLAGLRRGGLVRRERSSQDRRASVLGLTPAGRRAFDRLDRKATVEVSALLRAFPDGQRAERLDVIAAGERPWLNPQATFSLPQLGRAARSDARARAQLRLLRGAVAADLFRDERGRWPTGAELAAALGSGDALEIEAHGDSATVVDPGVPRGELAVSVRVDAPLR